jgi:hypothetical protein
MFQKEIRISHLHCDLDSLSPMMLIYQGCGGGGSLACPNLPQLGPSNWDEILVRFH